MLAVFLFTGKEDAILEARVIGADPVRPETGGVVEGSASRYRSRKAYPNAAVVSVTFQKVKGGIPPAERVAKVLDAARDVDVARSERRVRPALDERVDRVAIGRDRERGELSVRVDRAHDARASFHGLLVRGNLKHTVGRRIDDHRS